jgi:O-antigen/teichoic acid export membrane protein
MTMLAKFASRERLDSLFAVAAKMAAAFFSFLVTLIVARQYGVEASGHLALALMLMSISIIVGGFGLDLTTVQNLSRYAVAGNDRSYQIWLMNAAVISISGSVTIMLIIYVCTKLYNFSSVYNDVLELYIFIILSGILVTVVRLFSAAIRALNQNALASICDPFAVPFFFSILVMLSAQESYIRIGKIHFAACLIALMIALAVFIIVYKLKKFRNLKSKNISRSLIRRSSKIYFAQIIGFLSIWAPLIALTIFGSISDVAFYKVASQIALLFAFVQQAIEAATISRATALYMRNDLRELARMTQRQCGIVFGFTFIPSIVILAYPGAVLTLFGAGFESAATALRVLVAGQLFASAFGPIGAILLALRRQKTLLRSAMASGAVLIVGLAILAPTLGLVGAAISVAGAAILRTSLNAAALWTGWRIFPPAGVYRPQGRRGMDLDR